MPASSPNPSVTTAKLGPATTGALAPTTTGALAPTTTGMMAHAQGSRRGTWLVVGALLVAGLIGTAIVLATRKREPATANTVAKHIDRPIADASTPVAFADATNESVAAVMAVDAGIADAPRADPEAGGRRPDRRAEIAKLIGEAEDAKKARNLVRWVMKADAALQLDPRNVRARFLLADGLIASGDLDRGCKYLHELGKNPTARARANQAGCPSD
jgi:hypothetical protein